jgi:homoserine kinase
MMSGTETFQIKVPGSTSNLGPGFDSIGMAVGRYMTLTASRADHWSFYYPDQPNFHPAVEDNLIYRSAKQAAGGRALLPYSVCVRSNIPLARGLGSSGAAIVAGIELANSSLNLGLTIEEKAWLACRYEGHPDNVTPSLYGGLVVSMQSLEGVHSVRLPAPAFDFVTVIPNFELKTSDARNVLPTSLSYRRAIEGSSVANVMICALLRGDGALAGKMMEADRYHQPYRAKLIPDFATIAQLAKENGAYGTFLSGAGPTVMSLAPKGAGERAGGVLQDAFPDYEVVVLRPESEGVRTDPLPAQGNNIR